MAFTAKDVQTLRESTGAGMMDCKKALTEVNGDFEKAVAWLREKGIAKAAKREGRVAAEGAITSYIHLGGKLGVLIEVNCETDFVARGEVFQKFCKDLGMHIAFTKPRYLTKDEVSPEDLEKEKAIYVAQAKETGKPEAICVKIAEGKLQGYYKDNCLLEQESVLPDHEKKTISQVAAEVSSKCGEKVSIRRFVCWQLGEGIEKVKSDLAADVAAELAKHQG